MLVIRIHRLIVNSAGTSQNVPPLFSHVCLPVTLLDAYVKKPVISEICQIAGVEVNILGATVQEFGESIMCIFILQMFGSDDKLLQAEAQIDAAGVLRERVVFG